MAKLELTLPNELQNKLKTLSNKLDEVSEKALKAGGKILLSETKSQLKGVIGRGIKQSRSTGQLERSLGLSPVKLDRYGKSNIKVGFAEPRKDGKSNAMVANILEYGKSNQPARPFIAPAKRRGTKPALEAVKKVILEELKQ